jgi:hypothetical protein
MPRATHRRYSWKQKWFTIPAQPEKSAIFQSGPDTVAMTLIQVQEMHVKGLAVKVGLVTTNAILGNDIFKLISLPLYRKYEIFSSSSNLSLRMSPPIPMRKAILKIGWNPRRYKIRAFRKIEDSPYMRLIQSNLSIESECKHRKDQTSCAVCIMREWADPNPFIQEKKLMIDGVLTNVRTFSPPVPAVAAQHHSDESLLK